MERIPRIKYTEVIGQTQLLIVFENGVRKIYDCKHLFSRPQFRLLATFAFFKAARVERSGCAISWNDDIDLSECELWTNGKIVAKP